MFTQDYSIESIWLRNLKNNFLLKDCGKLSYNSIKFLIDESSNSNSVSVAVHQYIYNALLGENTEYPFNGGTKEEWEQLAQDAIEKQITFVTA